MRPVAEADAGRGAADLLHRHAVLQVAHAGAAVVLVHRQAEQAERAHLRPELWRKGIAAFDFGGERRDLLGGEAHHGVAQQVGRLAQREVEAGELVRAHRLALSSAAFAGLLVLPGLYDGGGSPASGMRARNTGAPRGPSPPRAGPGARRGASGSGSAARKAWGCRSSPRRPRPR